MANYPINHDELTGKKVHSSQEFSNGLPFIVTLWYNLSFRPSSVYHRKDTPEFLLWPCKKRTCPLITGPAQLVSLLNGLQNTLGSRLYPWPFKVLSSSVSRGDGTERHLPGSEMGLGLTLSESNVVDYEALNRSRFIRSWVKLLWCSVVTLCEVGDCEHILNTKWFHYRKFLNIHALTFLVNRKMDTEKGLRDKV